MLYEADILEEKNPEVFGEAGTYVLVYSLLCAALDFATAVGPALSGLIYEQANWAVSMLTLAGICLLGSVGVFLYTGGSSTKEEADNDVYFAPLFPQTNKLWSLLMVYNTWDSNEFIGRR